MSRRTFGSIRKLLSGRWQGELLARGPATRRPEEFQTKAWPTFWLSQMASQIYSGEWMDPRSGEIILSQVVRLVPRERHPQACDDARQGQVDHRYACSRCPATSPSRT